MRSQIAAANWKMNLTLQQSDKLLSEVLNATIESKENHKVLFGVPFPYLQSAQNKIAAQGKNFYISAQNCSNKKSGAFTGEVSAEMLRSIGLSYCIVGHSERREYFGETNTVIAEKINLLLENGIIPVFCCGEPLAIREAGTQNDYVAQQLRESIFHLPHAVMASIIIAYEPIWAIGTGKTATSEQAQEIHAFLRTVIASQYGPEVANVVPILYGGSVKADNAAEIFACPDVDGGLVGGASLVSSDFIKIVKSLKS